MQAVRPSLRAVHATLLQHLRVRVQGDVVSAAAPLSRWGSRTMSDEAHAPMTYLDRSEVVDRVLSVVKSNQKVDPSKLFSEVVERVVSGGFKQLALVINSHKVTSTLQLVPPIQVSETASFQGDLGLDSLDEVELVMAFEEEFALEIPDADADKIKSTSQAIEYIASHPRAK